MSRSRSSCPRSLEEKLNREVHYTCPICSSIPLVRAHTIKLFDEVGWNYDYLLAICVECEKKVERGEIDRNSLHVLKSKLKTSFSTTTRGKPYQIGPIISNEVYFGNNRISSTDIIFAYRGAPIIWLRTEEGVKTLNARFYDIKGTVITAIDKNMWTADRDRFYDIKVDRGGDMINMEIIGKKDATRIKLSICKKGIVFGSSEFYASHAKPRA